MRVPWDESKHPRGQPENAGEFGPGGGGASPRGKQKVTVEPGAGAKDGFDDLSHPAQAVRWYTGGGYDKINAVLRGQAQHTDETRKAAIAIHKEIAAHGDLGGRQTLHRVMNVQDPAAFVGQFTKGRKVSMKGFVSTSKQQMTARFGGLGAVVVQIETDRGLDLNAHGYSDNPDEQEVLLGTGWTYEVVGVGTTRHASGHAWPTVRLRLASAKVSGASDIKVEPHKSRVDDELVPVSMK